MTQTPAFLVIGAAGGIGSAICRRLSAASSRLILAGRDQARLEALASDTGGTVYPLDATQAEPLLACAMEAMEDGGLHGIINCAGSLLLKTADRTSPEEFDQVVATNLTTAFNTVRAAGTVLRRTGGSVVLFSSAAAQTGMANHDAIAAAKGGVEGLMRAAAASYASRGLRINCVAPGMVRTPLTAAITENENALKGSIGMHALGRIGEADDVAAAVEFLVNPANDWITGQTLGVDGGLANVRPRLRV